jgi:tetratricopeptide (TPR) repeat protein
VSSIVVLVAAAAALVTVLATHLTGTDATPAVPVAGPRPGAPPLVLDLGVRTDPEARALRKAAALYTEKRRAAAGRIFDRYTSVEARVGSAMVRWPEGYADLERVAGRSPASGAAQLNLGLGRFWQGQLESARDAWRSARAGEPDSMYAVRAGDLLFPQYPVPGLPTYVPGFASPPELDRLAPPAQLRLLERRAAAGGAREKILYGVALQRLGRARSAERQFTAAARRAPRDPEAATARAVGLFDKARPARAFSQLGPLGNRFPHTATVRFHLGLLLVWMGQVEDARRQFRLAQAAEPGSVHAKQAASFLARLPRG